MAVTLRIHRGTASPDRVVLVSKAPVGRLEDEVNEFVIEHGHHVLELQLGRYHGLPTSFTARDGDLLEFKAVEDPDAVLPLILGGAIKLERITHPPVLHP